MGNGPGGASRRVTAVIVGGGQAGLAASHCLAGHGIDHVVLERGEVANAWRRQRWDSLQLLTPNWLTRLPGCRYPCADPDGYMNAAQVADFISAYAASRGTPLHEQTRVTALQREDDGYRVRTDRGDWLCQENE